MPRHLFDRPQIVAAARRILDADGLDALTFRALASDLGTGPASLYRHVTDRRELLQLVADDAAAELPLPDSGLPARQRLTVSWLALYDHFAAHRWLVDLISAGDLVSDHASPLATAHLRTLTDLGLGTGDALRAYRSLNALMVGTLCSSHPYAHGVGDHAGTGADGHTGTPTSREVFAWAVDRLL